MAKDDTDVFKKSLATGVLISSCLVLTSAHTFYGISKTNKAAISTYTPQLFYAGVKTTLEAAEKIRVLKCQICPEFKRKIEEVRDLNVQKSQLSGLGLSPQQLKQKKKEIKDKIFEAIKQS